MIDLDLKPNKKKLRQFALLSLLFFGAFAVWRYLEAGSGILFFIFAGIAAIGAVSALLSPSLIRPIYIVLICITFPIGLVVSNVVLVLIFALLFTPIGVLMRLFGHDPLERKLKSGFGWLPSKKNKKAASYYNPF